MSPERPVHPVLVAADTAAGVVIGRGIIDGNPLTIGVGTDIFTAIVVFELAREFAQKTRQRDNKENQDK